MIEYSEIREEDIETLLDLYEKYLNSGEYVRNDIEKSYRREDHIGYKAVENGRIIGWTGVSEGIAFTYPHPELEEKLGRLVLGRKICTLDALLVLPSYRNHGVAHMLNKQLMKKVLDRQYDFILYEIWVYPDGEIPAQEIEGASLHIVYEELIKGFYKDGGAYGVSCPICGTECRCSALVRLAELT